MKKTLILTALILTIVSPVWADEAKNQDNVQMPVSLDIQKQFYESPLNQMPNVEVKTDNEQTVYSEDDEIDTSNRPPFGKNMPMFKRARIRLTNYFRQKSINNAQKLIDEEKAKTQNQAQSNIKVKDDGSVSLHSFEDEDDDFNIMNKMVNTESSVKSDGSKTDDNASIKLSGGVKEHISEKDVILDAQNVDFNDKTMDITAIGTPVLTFPQQDTVIKADKFVYNNVTNILKAYDNVEIIKNGSSIFGDFLQINMNEETELMDNMKSARGALEIHAKHVTSDDKQIVLEDGKLSADHDYVFKAQTSMIAGFNYNNMVIQDDDKSSVSDLSGSKAMNVKIKDITVDAKKQHNVVTLKGIEVYNGKHHLFDLASFQAHSNKDNNYFEGNYPELGSRNPMGMFAGPGYVLDVPNGSTLKLVPLINYKSKFGIGGALKYKSATNMTDFMYGSANDVFVLKGKQYLDDKLYLQYGMNAFLDEWFLGARMPRYSAELVFKDKKVIPDALGKGLNMRFAQRVSAGYMEDSNFQFRNENVPKGDATTRFRYMAEVNQSLYKYEDKKNLKMLDLGVIMQGSAGVYGTGDTQFIGRIGPRLHTQYKYWMQDLGFFASAYQDQTPLVRYDSYRYGHANVYFREALRVNKYLAVGWSASANLLKDAPNGKMLQENGFIISLGPDDLKFNIGYDFIRESTYFNISMAMNVKNSNVEYKKMVIKNPDRLTGDNKQDLTLLPRQDEFQPVAAKSVAPKLQYAQVIEIQDQDREYVQ